MISHTRIIHCKVKCLANFIQSDVAKIFLSLFLPISNQKVQVEFRRKGQKNFLPHRRKEQERFRPVICRRKINPVWEPINRNIHIHWVKKTNSGHFLLPTAIPLKFPFSALLLLFSCCQQNLRASPVFP